MTLISDGIYVVVIALFAIAIVGGALISRLIPRRWWGILLHGVVIAVASVLSVLAFGLTLNKQNSWYENVHELFAKQDVASDVVDKGRSPAFVAETAKPENTAKPLLPLPSPGKTLQFFQVPASIGTYRFNVRVILPSDYFSPESATKKYPVLMLGTGFPGHYTQWTERVGISTMADQLHDAGKIGRFVAVIPELFPNSIDTECMDGPTGMFQLETFLAKDLPEFLQARLRLETARTSWAWMGISSGGYCAAFQTIRHSDRYAGAATLGGYLRPNFGKVRPPFELSPQRLAYMDLIKAAAEKKPKVALWMFNVTTEGQYIAQSKELRAAAPEAAITLVHTQGAHSWDTWVPRVPTALAWLGQTLPGFKPGN